MTHMDTWVSQMRTQNREIVKLVAFQLLLGQISGPLEDPSPETFRRRTNLHCQQSSDPISQAFQTNPSISCFHHTTNASVLHLLAGPHFVYSSMTSINSLRFLRSRFTRSLLHTYVSSFSAW
jgi:hypothetical protein